jgi:uncharacterized repeat protein (TIGR01451 family)
MKSFLRYLQVIDRKASSSIAQHSRVNFTEGRNLPSQKLEVIALALGHKVILPVFVVCSFVTTKTVWAYVAPTGMSYTNATNGTLTLPGNLTATLAASGSNLVFDITLTTLNGLGGPASTFYSPQIATTTPAGEYDANLGGCANATTTVQTCSNRGSIRITFSQPVKNPRLHIAGVGGRTGTTLAYNSIITLSSARNGSTTVTPSWSLIAGNANISATSTSVSTTTLTNNTSCSATSGAVAGCGTLAINGTVTEITLNIALKYGLTSGTGTLAVSNTDIDGVTYTVTTDEDFGDAPSTFDPTQAARHVVSDLMLGASVDSENPSTANSTTSPNAVAAGSNNNGTNGDGADEDAIGSFPTLTTASTSYALTVPISGASKAGRVCGWVDFDNSNTFTATEGACSSFVAGATSVTLSWTGLSGLTTGNRYVRLRTSYDSNLATTTPAGRLDSGEVEDYQLTIAAPPVNLTVTKTTSTPNAVPGGAASYTITVSNASGASTATGVQISDTLPSGFTFDATLGNPTLSGGATRTSTQNPTQNTATPTWGTFDIPAGGRVSLNFAVNVSETSGVGTYQNPVSVTYSTGSANYNANASTGEDVTLSNFTPSALPPAPAPPVTLGGVCGLPGNDGPAPSTLAGVVNTYYPAVTASASAGSTSITIGAATGATTPIATGDLLLIVQMQDASIDSSNTASYGSGNSSNLGSGQTSMGNSGLYEYAVATNSVPLSGGTLNIRGANGGGLANTYVNQAATPSRGQRRFQIVRVPQYASMIISSTLSAAAWDGQTGGILALDVAGDLNFNNRSIDTINRGFRAGYSTKNISNNSTTTYVAPTSANVNGVSGGKGEGTAGTPRFVWNGTVAVDNGSDGYPNGDLGKGAPANAGGAGNAHNAGGGGGGNGGIGGQGGLPWRGAGGIIDAGGRPGLFSSLVSPAVWRLTLGGGGGGGDANNATTGVRGGVGGGLTIIRAGRMIGSGTILATGDDGDVGAFGTSPDGAGGGGAGGTVLLAARSSSSTASITVQANGGRGGNTLNDGGNEHGPGGGGGGGLVLYNVPGGLVSATVNGGATGKANGGAGIPHGAVAGQVGQVVPFTESQDPFAGVNSSNCFPQLSVVKTTSTPQVLPGTTATYTIALTNAVGKADAVSVSVTDNLPTNFTYTSTTAVNLINGATRPVTTNPTAGATAPTWGSFTIPGGGRVEVTFNVTVGSTVANGTYQNPATATYPDPTRLTVTDTATASYDSASSTGEDVTVGGPPNLLLVKRITRINNSQTSSGGDNLAAYNNTASPYDDNTDDTPPFAGEPNPNQDDTTNWPDADNNGQPDDFLIGGTNGGNVRPDDEVEYTIYFLSAGNNTANNVQMCDRVPQNQTFVPDAYNNISQVTGGIAGSDRGITVSYNGNSLSYTNSNDGDTARYYAPGVSLPAVCGTGANTNGAIVVNLGQGATATAGTNLGGSLSSANAVPATPINSYGFVRFKAKVN